MPRNEYVQPLKLHGYLLSPSTAKNGQKMNLLNRFLNRLSGAPEREAHERQLQAAQHALMNLALVNFSKALVAEASKGNGLQEDKLVWIKADCIARFHNYGALGLNIQDEAFVLNTALELLRQQLDQIQA